MGPQGGSDRRGAGRVRLAQDEALVVGVVRSRVPEFGLPLSLPNRAGRFARAMEGEPTIDTGARTSRTGSARLLLGQT